jgi:hypothetical protein
MTELIWQPVEERFWLPDPAVATGCGAATLLPLHDARVWLEPTM